MFKKALYILVFSLIGQSATLAQEEDGAVGDEMTQPRSLTTADPIYPPKAKRQDLEGWVLVGYDIDRDGRTKSVIPISSSDKMFEESALHAVRKYTFTPATRMGEPVDFPTQTARINFLLPKR